MSRRILLSTSLVHLSNDACFAILYPILPLIAADLELSYAQVGLLKATMTAAQSAFQVPAGMAGERFGEALVLLLGNAWVGLGLASLALAGSYLTLLALALLAGLGGNAQHPIGSAIVSRAYQRGRASTALGTLNFAGDLGKFLGPLLVGVLATQYGWRTALVAAGLPALLLSLLLLRRQVFLPVPPVVRVERATNRAGSDDRNRFRLLLLIGGLDSATRVAALTFLPFLLEGRGMPAAQLSLLFSLLFAAGAAGKFACGWLGDRWGLTAVVVTTELATALSLLAFLGFEALWVAFPLALAFGFVLNGTSSAFLAGVANLVPGERRARAYGVFFTASLGAAAVAPLVYGLLADDAGLTVTFLVLAVVTALIPLLAQPLRPAFQRV